MLRGIILSIVKCDIAVLLGGWLYKKIHELYGDWTVWVACILWPEKSAQVDWELYVQWLIKKKKFLKLLYQTGQHMGCGWSWKVLILINAAF